MRDKLQEILEDTAEAYYPFHEYGDTYKEYNLDRIKEGVQAILDLLDKSLPSHRRQVHVEHGQQMPSVAQCKWYFDGYDQALADIRKVIKEG